MERGVGKCAQSLLPNAGNKLPIIHFVKRRKYLRTGGVI